MDFVAVLVALSKSTIYFARAYCVVSGLHEIIPIKRNRAYVPRSCFHESVVATHRSLDAICCFAFHRLSNVDLSMLISSESRKWCSAIDPRKEWQSGKLRCRVNEINARRSEGTLSAKSRMIYTSRSVLNKVL